ncbi:aminotransferase class V-fold PLP-dependent enzyme [Rhodohalobacter sp. 8-1]|uniref:aminotransferase class V-fold PLP-dependent enzyme n=1 Tax=Rhodohalobacter sp. 8-1 TaxID=3131972 RepID=UPI0030EE1644
MSSPFSDIELTEIRALFPITRSRHVYMNHAAISPLPTPTFEATKKWLDVRNSGSVENFEEGMETVETARKRVASYINAPDSEHISFLGNTSDAISAISEGLQWNESDEIILNTLEFPTNVQPFRRLEQLGVTILYVEAENHRVHPSDIEALITPKTKLISISAVQYLSGFRADLKAIGDLCSKHDILFVVDGIQALGASPIDVMECKIDALATGAHKWLMSPMGIGFLYLSEKMQAVLEPYKTGWLSVEDPWALSEFEKAWLPVSQHLETGTPNIIAIAGLGASLKLFEGIGTELVRNHILHLSGYMLEALQSRSHVDVITPNDDTERLGIVTFSVESSLEADLDSVLGTLKEKDISISAREGFFRVSPHMYNTEEEIDRVMDELFKQL